MALPEYKIFKEPQKDPEKIYVKRDLTFAKELCKEYQKHKLSKSSITLFKQVVESMDAIEQAYDNVYIAKQTKEILRKKFKKNYYEYQIKRMGFETDKDIIEKFEYFKYYYFKDYQEILFRKFPSLSSGTPFTGIHGNKDVFLENNFDSDLINDSNYQKEKKTKLTESTAKLFLSIFENNDLYLLTNFNNYIFLVTDSLVDKFAETALDYQTSRMGLSSISEIIEKINWFCFFYAEDILNVIYQNTDDEELIRELKKIYSLN